MTTKTLALYEKLKKYPLGKWMFSYLICHRAPYFKTISPSIELSANEVTVKVKKTNKVLNHIGTVHAIAMCNASELAAGLLMEAGLPPALRWIPKSMRVAYLNKATTDIKAVAKLNDWTEVRPGDYNMTITVLDQKNEIVMEALITMWISEKKTKTTATKEHAMT